MSNRKATSFISDVIYHLKQDYGFSVTFYNVTATSINYETGAQTPTIEQKNVPLTVVLPETIASKLNPKATDSQFKYGGSFESNIKTLLVDQDDLDDFIIDENTYFGYENQRWNVKEVIKFDYQTAFLVIGQYVGGSTLNTVHELDIETSFDVTNNGAV